MLLPWYIGSPRLAPSHLTSPHIGWAEFVQLPFSATSQDHPCTMRGELACRSPSLGPMAVLGGWAGHRTKQHRTGSKAERHANFKSNPCPNISLSPHFLEEGNVRVHQSSELYMGTWNTLVAAQNFAISTDKHAP